MIREATCASTLTRKGPNTVPRKVIKHQKHTLAWQYKVYLGAEKTKPWWSVDCGCQNSQGKMCVNKNANISWAVRDICLTITHHPPQSFVIEIFYWPITSATCRRCETGRPSPCPGVWLLRASQRCSKCPWFAPSIRARGGLPSSLTPFSGCTEHFVSRNLQGILPHQHSKTAVQSRMNVPPTAVHTGDSCWGPRGLEPSGTTIYLGFSTYIEHSSTSSKVYTVQFVVSSWKLHFLSL